MSIAQHSDPAIQALREWDQSTVETLQRILFNDDYDKLAKWHEVLKDPIFKHKFLMSLDEQRELAMAQIQKVADAGLASIYNFGNDPKNIFTAHEILGQVNGSLATKFTVQFNLFGGTLQALSTERHAPFLAQVDSLKNMGCFCFTELGYGNNAPKMETTAHYDPATRQFTINSPTVASQKFWITNGAKHANFAVVFAQTHVAGKNEGINAFIVPIRDENMNACNGVFIEDMGVKLGMNGIDNARLSFDHVKIPLENHLNAQNQITPEGKFISDTPKVSQRFFKVADRLLSGRLCISAMCMGTTKYLLYTTIRYSQQRLAVGPSGESDTPIMSYQLQQNAIFPYLARTLVYNLGYNEAKNIFADPRGRENEQVRIFCAAKCLVSWNLEATARTCRERCGGGSFLSSSAIPEGLQGGHSGMTAEGDNRVLMQKIVKDVLADMQKEQHRLPKMTQCPKRQIPALKSIANLETLINLTFYREVAEIKSMSKLMQKKMIVEGKKFFDVWMYEVSDEIQSLAFAFSERYMLESTLNVINKTSHAGTKALLEQATFLYLIWTIKNNLDWYVIDGVVSAEAASKVDDEFSQAVKDFVPFVNTALESFSIAKHPHLHAPIARDYVAFNAQPDFENFESAGKLFDFRNTGVPRPSAPRTSAKL